MKGKLMAMMLAVSLTLSGCGWMDGSYVSVTPHREQRSNQPQAAATAASYKELTSALEQVISSGQEAAAIQVPEYPEEALPGDISGAVRYATTAYPIGVYAVEHMDCQLGTSGGVPAVAVTVTYRRSLSEIQGVRPVKDMAGAERSVSLALENYGAGTVLLVEEYEREDMTQYVQDYAAAHPQTVMETPQVTEMTYGRGKSRVVELIFTYQNSRDDLRKMQSQVAPVFNAASLYVSGDGAERQKYAQLYAFLMERFDYKIETSLTPAYSLLRHGVGDSRAFATVYAAMCRDAGLECLTVTGTHAGEPRTWNIVREEEQYFHVDLLRCSELGGYHAFTDGEMEEYVWDYSAYPASGKTWKGAGETASGGSQEEPEKIAEEAE